MVLPTGPVLRHPTRPTQTNKGATNKPMATARQRVFENTVLSSQNVCSCSFPCKKSKRTSKSKKERFDLPVRSQDIAVRRGDGVLPGRQTDDRTHHPDTAVAQPDQNSARAVTLEKIGIAIGVGGSPLRQSLVGRQTKEYIVRIGTLDVSRSAGFVIVPDMAI